MEACSRDDICSRRLHLDSIKQAAEYQNLQSSAMAAAKRGYVDDIVNPEDTRKRVIAAFDMLFTKREDRPAKKHGTV